MYLWSLGCRLLSAYSHSSVWIAKPIWCSDHRLRQQPRTDRSELNQVERLDNSCERSNHLGEFRRGVVVVGRVVVGPEVGDDVAVAEGELGGRLRVGVGRPREEGAGRGRRHPAVVHAGRACSEGGQMIREIEFITLIH